MLKLLLSTKFLREGIGSWTKLLAWNYLALDQFLILDFQLAGKIWMMMSNFWTTLFWTWKPKPAIFFMSFKFLVFTIRIFLCPKKHRLNDNMMMQSKKSIKQWRFGLRPVKTSNVSQRRGMQPCRYDLYNTLVLLIQIIFIVLLIQMRGCQRLQR